MYLCMHVDSTCIHCRSRTHDDNERKTTKGKNIRSTIIAFLLSTIKNMEVVYKLAGGNLSPFIPKNRQCKVSSLSLRTLRVKRGALCTWRPCLDECGMRYSSQVGSQRPWRDGHKNLKVVTVYSYFSGSGVKTDVHNKVTFSVWHKKVVSMNKLTDFSLLLLVAIICPFTYD